MKGKTLFYFEDSIESSFGRTDIEMLASRFDKTVIFTDRRDQKYPESVILAEDYLDWRRFAPLKILVFNFGLVLSIFFGAFYEKEMSLFRSITVLKKIVSNIFRANEITKYAKSHGYDFGKTCLYSFWFYDSLFLAVIKKQYPKALTVNRAHGGDIFEDQTTLRGKVLLRKYQLSKIDWVVTVSRDGANYLKRLYPNYAHKIDYIYLGTSSHNDINPFNRSQFTIVSCSHIRDVKRVDRIAESISKLDFEVVWYHIGKENLEQAEKDPSVRRYFEVKEGELRKPNIQFIATGEWMPERVMEFYRLTPVNLFLSLSVTEGVPVSMMEAISFGIPIMATDVGGCSEIVNSTTGVLLDAGIEPESVAERIMDFKAGPLNRPETRQSIKKFWSENFSQEVNYDILIESMRRKF